MVFLSTPSARRATLQVSALAQGLTHFYPRPPRGGRRPPPRASTACGRFLSTPSARRATADQAGVCGEHQISIHALREEGDQAAPQRRAPHHISIHALREEGDLTYLRYSGASRISIHALREEGDPALRSPDPRPCHFYPRPPRGGRPSGWAPASLTMQFLSTPSARRATALPPGVLAPPF